ncbi:MAG: hypothetical protein COA79_19955 [Planctomycetota bacterium]|nr:MAG: hypothetical protein COA79_19955 [Planctomycetota bacterium]
MKLLQIILILSFLNLTAFAQDENSSKQLPYKNDPVVVSKLNALKGNESIKLSNPKVEGLSGGWKKSSRFSHGPFTRDYCTKMPYASDRQTAVYCGQGHNDPHYNDAWEYHLGSNTWHCLTMPDGGSTAKYMRTMWVKVYGRNGKGKEKNEEKRLKMKKEIHDWVEKNIVIKNGYPQTSKNAGPVFQWHTWDGLTYDPLNGKMHWAVLGNQESNLKRYCTALGKDFNEEKKKTKEALGLFSFDPIAKKWSIHFRKNPMPRMRGMGGSLTYIPDLQQIIWYVAASNVSPGDYAMWSWDLKKDTWSELKPNGGKSIRTLVEKEKVAPGEELQMAYSVKHKALVCAQGQFVFVYNFQKNEWKKVAENKDVHAYDSHTVFDYDSVNDVFILVQPKHSHATYNPVKYHKHKKGLFAFSLNTKKWEELTPTGAGLFMKPKYSALKGYYDPQHNAFIISSKGVWVYRYKEK